MRAAGYGLFFLSWRAMEGRRLNYNIWNVFSWLLTSKDHFFVLHLFIKCMFKYGKTHICICWWHIRVKGFYRRLHFGFLFLSVGWRKKVYFQMNTVFFSHRHDFTCSASPSEDYVILTIFCDSQELPSVSALSKYLRTWSFFLLLLISSLCQI